MGRDETELVIDAPGLRGCWGGVTGRLWLILRLKGPTVGCFCADSSLEPDAAVGWRTLPSRTPEKSSSGHPWRWRISTSSTGFVPVSSKHFPEWTEGDAGSAAVIGLWAVNDWFNGKTVGARRFIGVWNRVRIRSRELGCGAGPPVTLDILVHKTLG